MAPGMHIVSAGEFCSIRFAWMCLMMELPITSSCRCLLLFAELLVSVLIVILLVLLKIKKCCIILDGLKIILAAGGLYDCSVP